MGYERIAFCVATHLIEVTCRSLDDQSLMRSRELRQLLVHPGSFRLDVGRSDHLGPPVSFIGKELAEFSGRHWHWQGAEIREPLLDLRISESGIISRLSFSINPAGVFFGAPIPNQTVAS